MTNKLHLEIFILFILIILLVSLVAAFSLSLCPTIFFDNANILQNDKLIEIWKYYEQHLRGNLFAGLISVSAFLMTGMTFILVTMKQNVFEDKRYIARFEKMKALDNTLTLYKPLIELKNLLYLAVTTTFVAAIIQFTIGLVPHWSAAIFAIAVSIISIILVLESLMAMKRNLNAWLKED